MTTAALAVVSFANRNGIAKDAVVNDIAFTIPGIADVNTFGVLAEASVEDFYNGANTTHTLAYYMAYSLDRTAGMATTKWYDLTGHLNGTPHGSPGRVDTWTLGAVGGGLGLAPAECAACLSFHSAYGGDLEESGATRPKQRDRGRIYLPLNNGAMGDVAGFGNPELLAAFRTDCTVAMKRFHDAVAGLAGAPNWAVWSRAKATVQAVIAGSVDNAPDTQRRRGFKATAKTSLTF